MSGRAMRLLVSVRSVDEALLAAAGGAHFIDLKEPGQGALGGLPLPIIQDIVLALRAQNLQLPISATIGDWPMRAMSEIATRVAAVAACGVDYVKVGITREAQASVVLRWLADCGHAIVPVFIADQGVDAAHWALALSLPFAGVMLDTADKKTGSLFDVMPTEAVRHFISSARDAGLMVGVAGALRITQAPLLAQLAPDFAGFRSAVCLGERSAALDVQRLRDLVAAMEDATAQTQASNERNSPISKERIQANSVL
jgi:(5-formylfuran-3-yl)methyl phosphate synthase